MKKEKESKVCLCWVFVACECPNKNVSDKCNYLCSKFSSNHICVWQCTIFCLVNFAFCNCQSLHGVMTLRNTRSTVSPFNQWMKCPPTFPCLFPTLMPPPPPPTNPCFLCHCAPYYFNVILIYTPSHANAFYKSRKEVWRHPVSEHSEAKSSCYNVSFRMFDWTPLVCPREARVPFLKSPASYMKWSRRAVLWLPWSHLMMGF